jgi:hypothetical protein
VCGFNELRLFNTEIFTMAANTEACHSGEGSKVLNRLPQLAEPLLQFDLREELEQLRREDSWQRETGRSSKTLAKYPDFRITLVLMKAKTQMNEHRAEGRISIHHLLGRICIHLPDQKVNLEVGQLLVLDVAWYTTSKHWKRVRSCAPFLGPRAHLDPDAEMSSALTEILPSKTSATDLNMLGIAEESPTVCERTMTGVIAQSTKHLLPNME